MFINKPKVPKLLKQLHKKRFSYHRIILWLMLSSNGKGDEFGLSTPSKGTDTDACWDCGASPHLLSTCGETIGSGTWPKGSGSIIILIQSVIKNSNNSKLIR